MPKADPTTTIPDHHRRDGTWCRWSGIDTRRADGLCPDRCTATLGQLVRDALGPRAAHVQISEIDGRVYLRTRNPRIVPGSVISDVIEHAPDLVLVGVTAAIPPVYCVRRFGEA